MNSKKNSESNKNSVELGDSFFDGFTPAARDALTRAVGKYARSVRDEATRLQKKEQHGQLGIEIAATHIEMGVQECERKPRRYRQSVWVWVIKAINSLLLVGVGIGGSNLSTDWGLVLLIVTLVFAAALFIVDRELTREN